MAIAYSFSLLEEGSYINPDTNKELGSILFCCLLSKLYTNICREFTWSLHILLHQQIRVLLNTVFLYTTIHFVYSFLKETLDSSAIIITCCYNLVQSNVWYEHHNYALSFHSRIRRNIGVAQFRRGRSIFRNIFLGLYFMDYRYG